MLTLIATVVLLGVLIFVHELGHFLTAKAVDIRVPRFSIGFGPKIFGFRRGETEYVVAWIPLGGYVKMAGMDEMEAVEGTDDAGQVHTETVAVPMTDAGIADVENYDDVERHFESKSLPARFLVISAGVIMNFLFAGLIWALIAGVWGVPEEAEPIIGAVRTDRLPAGTESLADLPPGSRIIAIGDDAIETRDDLLEAIATAPPGPLIMRFEDTDSRIIELPAEEQGRRELLEAMVPPWPAIIGEVLAGEPADEGGMQAGDRVVRAGGREIDGYLALVEVIEANPDVAVPMTVERDGQLVDLTITPSAVVHAESGETIGRVGIASSIPRERLGFLASIRHGASEVVNWSGFIVQSLRRLITGQESVKNLGGPVMIGDLAGRFARAGLPHFLNFMAIFSVNLAVLNLLPIPVLDGGHLLFLTIEAVRGRALSITQRMRLSQVGLVILVAIMVLALANDLIRVVERVVGG